MNTIISLLIYAFSFVLGTKQATDNKVSSTPPIEQDKTSSFYHS